MITKRSSRMGQTSNHGMSEIDVTKRRLMEDKFETEATKISASCGNGCLFHFINEEVTLRDSILLTDHIRINNLCPFCKVTDGTENFRFCAKNQNKLMEVDFIMDGITYKTIYKPDHYSFLPYVEEE